MGTKTNLTATIIGAISLLVVVAIGDKGDDYTFSTIDTTTETMKAFVFFIALVLIT